MTVDLNECGCYLYAVQNHRLQYSLDFIFDLFCVLLLIHPQEGVMYCDECLVCMSVYLSVHLYAHVSQKLQFCACWLALSLCPTGGIAICYVLVQGESKKVPLPYILASARPFWAKFCPIIDNLYSHMCAKFGEFMLKCNKLWGHFLTSIPIFTVSELTEIKVQWLHQQGWMVAKFAWPQSVRLLCLGSNSGSLA